MNTSPSTSKRAVLPQRREDLYDVCELPEDDDGDLMPAGEAVPAATIAGKLRARIYSGEYPPGSRFPSRARIAAEENVSPESASVAMRMLRDEGLITLEQGRGTFVGVLADWLLTISAALPAGSRLPQGTKSAATKVIRDDPAIEGLTLSQFGDGPYWTWTVAVRAAGASAALAAAERAVRRVTGGVQWDYLKVSCTVEPR